jgi:uncharacterized protein
MDRIDVFAVARNRSDWEGQLRFSAMPRLCASLMADATGNGPGDGNLAYRCRGAIDQQGRPGLQLWLDAVLPLRCDRCTQKLDLVLAAERQFYFVETAAELAAIAIDNTLEEALLGGTQFDLATLIEDEAILQLPISPRHAHCIAVAHAMPGQEDRLARETLPPVAERPHPFAGLAALRSHLHHSGADGPPRRGRGAADVAPASPAEAEARDVPPAGSSKKGQDGP